MTNKEKLLAKKQKNFELRNKHFVLKVNGKKIFKGRIYDIVRYLINHDIGNFDDDKYYSKIYSEYSIDYKLKVGVAYNDIKKMEGIELL